MWIFHTGTCAAVFVLRRTMPIEKYPREFKVPLAIPAIMGVVGSYLVLVPFIQVVKHFTTMIQNASRNLTKLAILKHSSILDTFMCLDGLESD